MNVIVIALSVIFFLHNALFSVSVDLSSQDFKRTIPADEKIELYNFQKNTLYIFTSQNGAKLSLEQQLPGSILREGALLIEIREKLPSATQAQLSLSSPAKRLSLLTIKTDLYPNLGNEKWEQFIDEAKDWTTPSPHMQWLVEMSDKPLQQVLCVGCETGKDALFFAQQGAQVTLLDGTPHAIAITALRFASQLSQLQGAYVAMLEAIPQDIGLFDAVVGSAVYPFIPPEHFERTMRENILSHIAPGGYFAGIFFGKEHGWAESSNKTFVTKEKLIDLFQQCGFEIVLLVEEKSREETVFKGSVLWHTFQIIAKNKSQ